MEVQAGQVERYACKSNRHHHVQLQSLIRDKAMQNLSDQPGTRFLAPEVLARISSLELIARSVVEGFIAGLHRSPYLGFSTDFAEHRPYMPGDDPRHLAWKLLARTDRLYRKKYQGDTNARIHLRIDSSASMGYASGEVTKLQYAQYLA